MDTIGEDCERVGDIKSAIQVFNSICWRIRILPMRMITLPAAYLADGQRAAPAKMKAIGFKHVVNGQDDG